MGSRQNAEFLDRVRETCGLEAQHQTSLNNLGGKGDSVEDVLSTPGGDISSSTITAGCKFSKIGVGDFMITYQDQYFSVHPYYKGCSLGQCRADLSQWQRV